MQSQLLAILSNAHDLRLRDPNVNAQETSGLPRKALGCMTSTSPPALVAFTAAWKCRHAAKLHGLLSLPAAETKVRVS